MNNCFTIDYLTVNVKKIEAPVLLKAFCDSVKNNDVIMDNFTYRNFGGMRGYNKSYAFLDEDLIRISFHDEHPDFGVSINLTGKGCKFITGDDLISFIASLRADGYSYSVTRLDVAYDDFNKSIPVNDMIESVYSFIDYNKSISTRIDKRSVCLYEGAYNGVRYKNFEIGTRTSTGRIRLYDKRAEQRVDELEYWYRLELELRKEKSQAFLDMFVDGSGLSDIYISALESIVRFVDDRYEDSSHRSHCKNEIWFDGFLEVLGNCSSKYTFKN